MFPMEPIRKQIKKRPYSLLLLVGFLAGMAFIVVSGRIVAYTSTDAFCMSCHVHPHAEDNWRLSTHYDNKSGIVVHCVQCHLPPPGTLRYLTAKAVTGARDVYGMVFKDTDNINWEAKRQLSQAVRHTYEESCKTCHQNLFPLQLSEEGMHAHLYYTDNEAELNCLNCHLHVGHYSEYAQQTIDFGLSQLERETAEIYEEPAMVRAFERFTEFIPGTGVSFDMLPIPGGRFRMGSPPGEHGRADNEGPFHTIEISPYFMAEVEVTWDMYMAFFRETASEGRTDQSTYIHLTRDMDDLDAISGPTPPWGSPDQGWGWGDRPAITMTYHAAETFCAWLSIKTGKPYRLPTEAEWEYAARGNTTSPYFFEGDPKRFTSDRLINRIFGQDTTNINSHVIYAANSMARTQPPGAVRPNPFGLKNMLGNVWEFCSDFYSENPFAGYPEEGVIRDPRGPADGSERVIRGGSFNSDAVEVRSASRSHTRHQQWLITDPQIPKSIWWYSDNNEVGFRVVLDWPLD
jgi:formylglycine-generating enzyme